MFMLLQARKINLLPAALTGTRNEAVVNLKNKTITPEYRDEEHSYFVSQRLKRYRSYSHRIQCDAIV